MYTIEQLNAHADSLDVDGMVNEHSLITPEGAKATPDEIMAKICGIYHKVRPFLELFTNLWFLPKKLRTPVISYMVVLDGLCPTE